MKKIIASIVAVGAVVAALVNGYFLFFKSSDSDTGESSQASSSQAKQSSEASTSEASSVEEKTASTLADNVYTGKVVSTNRGDYQVKITVESGAISTIDVVEYPTDNERSTSINENALPQYVSQAKENQSAEVNLISGATEAYNGFTGSLQDAINQAQS